MEAGERGAPPPLGEHERPLTLVVSIVVAVAVAIAVIVGGVILDSHKKGGSVAGALFLATVLVVVAVAMYQRRYWAVVAFELLIGFQVLAASVALVVASTLRAAAICLVSIGLGGLLFWKLVRVVGRIQATDRSDLSGGHDGRLEPPV